mgnify:CR=1 FL=1
MEELIQRKNDILARICNVVEKVENPVVVEEPGAAPTVVANPGEAPAVVEKPT